MSTGSDSPRQDAPPARGPITAGSAGFAARFQSIAPHAGKRMLQDEELIVLAAESLARTYTREERKYR
jgi:hypothetical protein